MKLVISHADLSRLLGKVQNVVSQKATIPILANILLEARAGMLTVTATDLTVGVRCQTEAKILEEGATTLPARRFCQLIKELTAPHLEITTNEHDITEIVAGSSRFKLHGMSKNEYPALPELADAAHFSLSQEELKEMFFHTAFAVSREDSRYVLTGVFMQVHDGSAVFVGTDGKRLAKNRIPVKLDSSFNGEFIVPLKAVEEIIKNLENGKEKATVYLMKDKIAVETGHSILITKLLSGEYPDINRIIPDRMDKHMSLHRDELISLLRQVSLFTSDSNQSVKFSFSNGELKLSANAMEVGEGQVSMPVNYQGERLDIAFNPNFFLDILRHTREETVDMGLIDPYNPVIIREERVEEGTDRRKAAEDALCLIMPMRLDQ